MINRKLSTVGGVLGATATATALALSSGSAAQASGWINVTGSGHILTITDPYAGTGVYYTQLYFSNGYERITSLDNQNYPVVTHVGINGFSTAPDALTGTSTGAPGGTTNACGQPVPGGFQPYPAQPSSNAQQPAQYEDAVGTDGPNLVVNTQGRGAIFDVVVSWYNPYTGAQEQLLLTVPGGAVITDINLVQGSTRGGVLS